MHHYFKLKHIAFGNATWPINSLKLFIRHPIANPLQQDMGCFLCIQNVIWFLPFQLPCYMPYHIIVHCTVWKPDYKIKMIQCINVIVIRADQIWYLKCMYLYCSNILIPFCCSNWYVLEDAHHWFWYQICMAGYLRSMIKKTIISRNIHN